MTHLMRIFAVIMAVLFTFAACDGDTIEPTPVGNDTVVTPDNTTPPTDVTNPPDTATPPDVVETDYCAAMKAAGHCRTWDAFDYNGDPETGEVYVTCENSTNSKRPNECAVTQENDHVFVLLKVTFYGTHVPSMDNPFKNTSATSGEDMMWFEDDLKNGGSTLHLYAKFPDEDNPLVLISR